MLKRMIYLAIVLPVVLLSACMIVNQKVLDFGPYETTKTFTVTIIGECGFWITPSESWVTVEPITGRQTSTVYVMVDRSGLEPGTYEAILTVENSNFGYETVLVKMEVTEPWV